MTDYKSSNNYILYYIIGELRTNAFLVDSDSWDLLTSKEMPTSDEVLIAFCNTSNPTRVYIFEDHSQYGLYPLDYIVYGKESNYAQVAFPIQNDAFGTNRSYDDQISVIYSTKTIVEKLSFQFEVSSFHLSTPLINLVLRPAKQCILYFINDHTYLTLGIDHLLKIHNRYRIGTAEDAMYFLSKSIEMYDYDGDIMIGGNISQKSQIGHKIQTHFNRVSFYSANLDESNLLFLKQS